jgi:threonine dehydrogenase-like Zn-dependent dehydrogenase
MTELLQRITAGDLRPQEIITHVLPLDDAAKGYETFNAKTEGCRKVVLKPRA